MKLDQNILKTKEKVSRCWFKEYAYQFSKIGAREISKIGGTERGEKRRTPYPNLAKVNESRQHAEQLTIIPC